MASPVDLAQAALASLILLHGQAPMRRAEVIVALGGDGLMLATLHGTDEAPARDARDDDDDDDADDDADDDDDDGATAAAARRKRRRGQAQMEAARAAAQPEEQFRVAGSGHAPHGNESGEHGGAYDDDVDL